MDALISETDEAGRPVAYDRVAGVVVTGNEDGAHHVIVEVAGALIDIGYTVPGLDLLEQGPGTRAQLPRDHEWSHSTGRVATAKALRANPLPPPA